MVIGTAGGRTSESAYILRAEEGRVPSSGVEPIDDIVPDADSDGVEPSKEYSPTFDVGNGARRSDAVEELELCRDIITEDDLPSGVTVRQRFRETPLMLVSK